ncbi:transporter substrate-binding domain-containing protein [Edaphobacter modestus]|uniref:transporter substrate-binding domain-containing protein n=1 Tax=Edaphobacter modestus TaxID=388466 RepID=UPI00102C6165|nr:transporter substrate-binding domain-containing protein [Edaphobacter modestus]
MKLQKSKPGLTVTFIPMRIDQIEAALTGGVGDIIAYEVIITPDREKRVAFQETVTNVANIYKYYVAYKLALEQSRIRQKQKVYWQIKDVSVKKSVSKLAGASVLVFDRLRLARHQH